MNKEQQELLDLIIGTGKTVIDRAKAGLSKFESDLKKGPMNAESDNWPEDTWPEWNEDPITLRSGDEFLLEYGSESILMVVNSVTGDKNHAAILVSAVDKGA